MITSTSNEQIKRIVKLREKSKERKTEGLFVVEGIRIFKEIPAMDIDSVYVSESFVETYINVDKESATENRYDNIPDLFSRVDYTVVADNVFKKLSDTVNPQGVLAVVRMADYTLDEVLSNRDKENSCIVVLDKIQDPGNLGTIIRTGEGAGISAVVMSSDTVDLYNPKVIRSTMGSIFRVPCVIVDDLGAAVNEMKASGVTTYAAHLDGEDISSVELANDRAFLIGNEANGLSDEVASLADKKIKIPMEGEVESLNAAVATAILIYR
ncbi:MAG: RNA methyltransferase [Eubacterium sp.]|nr:RNA methyltransferase [Eubacterium sp.]